MKRSKSAKIMWSNGAEKENICGNDPVLIRHKNMKLYTLKMIPWRAERPYIGNIWTPFTPPPPPPPPPTPPAQNSVALPMTARKFSLRHSFVTSNMSGRLDPRFLLLQVSPSSPLPFPSPSHFPISTGPLQCDTCKDRSAALEAVT